MEVMLHVELQVLLLLMQKILILMIFYQQIHNEHIPYIFVQEIQHEIIVLLGIIFINMIELILRYQIIIHRIIIFGEIQAIQLSYHLMILIVQLPDQFLIFKQQDTVGEQLVILLEVQFEQIFLYDQIEKILYVIKHGIVRETQVQFDLQL